MRRATLNRLLAHSATRISIHALLAESDCWRLEGARLAPSISIHALLAESDRSTIRWGDVYSQFQSTLSLRRATWNRTTSVPFSLFQSTLSLRRATDFVPAISSLIEISIHALLAESDLDLGIYRFECRHFNPRSPCGERQDAWIGDGEVVQISIHALLAESDLANFGHNRGSSKFQSTLSLRRATKGFVCCI